MTEHYTHTGRFVFEGVEVLRYGIVLPYFSDKDRITAFYREIYDRVVYYCENELREFSAEKYSLSDMPKKRFVYPPVCYRLEGKVTHSDGELMFIRLTAEARQKALMEGIRAYDAHAWSLNEQCLLPPKMAARSFFGARRLPRGIGKNGFLVENGEPYLCYGDRLLRIADKKKSE